MEFAVLGGPEEGPTLRLDHERFPYAGKFVVGTTGKAVVREDDEVIAAAAFDRDRTDSGVAVVRYVAVRNDRRSEGVGARLLAGLADRLLGEDDAQDGDDAPDAEGPSDGDDAPNRDDPLPGIRRVRISVNNPFAYEAAYKAGFAYTGEESGLTELVLARPGDRSPRRYRDGLDAFRSREGISEAEGTFLEDRRGAEPPDLTSPLRRG